MISLSLNELLPKTYYNKFLTFMHYARVLKKLIGLLIGDKGYVKQELFNELYERGLKLVTGLRKNMKNKLMLWQEKLLLRKRSLIETVFDYLKNKFQLEHTRHRSPWNAIVHILSTLIAYSFKSHKPKIKFNHLIPNSR